jgi:L-arabinose isomerase
MRIVHPLLLVVLVLLTGRDLAAQQSVHFMRESVLRPVAAEDRVTVDRVREDLAKIRLAQESYYTANQTYASEVTDLKGVKLSAGISVVILMSSPMGWKAEAAHTSLKGAEVVHVMRMEKGEKCTMMENGGMGGMGAMKGMSGMERGAPPPAEPPHQH